MPSRPAISPSTRAATIGATDRLGLSELRSASGLSAQLLPSGVLFALRHERTLINQVLPGPAEEGLLRLFVRRNEGSRWIGANAIGANAGYEGAGQTSARWSSEPVPGLRCHVQLALHPTRPVWGLRIRIVNTSDTAAEVDAMVAQDLGLSDEGAVRNNEAYTSHYLDLLPLEDARLGWVLCARQNQEAAGARHPWLGAVCRSGACAFATDAIQVFGDDHRLTGRAAAVPRGLPSRRLQAELATAALQSRPQLLPPGEAGVIEFLFGYEPDHPAASGTEDVERLRALLDLEWPEPAAIAVPRSKAPPGLFVTAPWLHGRDPFEHELAQWFPGAHRHEERDPAGALQSFFYDDCAHVVLRAKEATVARPHGHILRTGDSLWLEPDHLGLTAYAAGLFGAQVYLGNTNLGRLLSVARHPLNLVRGSGQRVFVRQGSGWHQLGLPSAFELRPHELRWWYRIDPDVLIVARAWCAHELPASVLHLEVKSGPAVEFLVTHQVVLGPNEFDQPARVELHADRSLALLRPEPGTLLADRLSQAGFVIGSPGEAAAAGLDGALYPDGRDRGGPYVTLQTGPASAAVVVLVGREGNDAELLDTFARAGTDGPPARVPLPPVRLRAPEAVARVDDALPWFTHNAWIHFSAPHGLEQSGGAAWGVRDVCQGSIEWLLAAGEWAAARRALLTVFSRQFADGSWPQWFMHEPFREIQSHHSHGDVCFWPVKALCDTVEASNDLSLLHERCRYADVTTGAPADANDTLLEHAVRVLLHVASRFVPGTALVNYGDGDWDDTLQPADPGMRTRMISGWTVALSYHTFRQFAHVCARAGAHARAAQLQGLLGQIRRDFAAHLMPDGIAAGFLVREPTGERVLLHPRDTVTGIDYRLLPMTRAILAELFTPEEARRHLEIVRDALLYPDGARLMSAPARYRGGLEQLFKRGDTAANVGREIGLQYVHAHLRYAEALAKVGDADGLWWALQVVNPVGLREILPQALPRQANVYFSSSDADFPDRFVAAQRWPDLRAGRVAVRGGWRLYSSGPGLFLHKVRACLLGIRESFDELVLDPVLPRSLDGLVAETHLAGCRVELHYRVKHATSAPAALVVNGAPVPPLGRDANPYRSGGLRFHRAGLRALLTADINRLEVEL